MKHVLPLLLLLALAACRTQTPTPPDAMTPEPALPDTRFFEITVAGQPGRMVLRLYDETPLHRDNFRKLAAEGFYDGTTFHRVIANFMIQGGDPNSRDDDPTNDGQGGPGYTIPAEIRPDLFHRRGALAAARTGDDVNPERRSSGSQFYIVHGAPVDSFTLAGMENRIRQATGNAAFAFPPDVRQVYAQQGGTPHLDQQYTVFGQLVEGFDLLDRLAAAETARSTRRPAHPAMADQPFQPLTMTIRPLPDYQAPVEARP